MIYRHGGSVSGVRRLVTLGLARNFLNGYQVRAMIMRATTAHIPARGHVDCNTRIYRCDSSRQEVKTVGYKQIKFLQCHSILNYHEIGMPSRTNSPDLKWKIGLRHNNYLMLHWCKGDSRTFTSDYVNATKTYVMWSKHIFGTSKNSKEYIFDSYLYVTCVSYPIFQTILRALSIKIRSDKNR
jgi:hypothetical protein